MRTEELTAKALKLGIDRYELAIAVAKRSVELDNGTASKLNVDIRTKKSADIALLEIAEGLVSIKGFIPLEK